MKIPLKLKVVNWPDNPKVVSQFDEEIELDYNMLNSPWKLDTYDKNKQLVPANTVRDAYWSNAFSKYSTVGGSGVLRHGTGPLTNIGKWIPNPTNDPNIKYQVI